MDNTTLAAPALNQRDWPRTLLTVAALVPLTLLILAPMWHMLVYAFVPRDQQFLWPVQWVPTNWTLGNFDALFADPGMPAQRWFMNTVLVTLGGTVLVVTISAISGYAFARLNFPGRDTMFFVMLTGLMVPTAVTLIPTFIFLRDLKLLDTHVALWVPALTNATGVFLLRQAFFGIPAELEDAATMDGAGRLRIFLQVCLPLVRSAVLTLTILTFLLFWNDLLWPLVVLTDNTKLTLPVGILFLGWRNGFGLYFAAGVLSALPALGFYLLFHKQVVQGVQAADLAGR